VHEHKAVARGWRLTFARLVLRLECSSIAIKIHVIISVVEIISSRTLNTRLTLSLPPRTRTFSVKNISKNGFRLSGCTFPGEPCSILARPIGYVRMQ
jgi:hypothetical protein